jgi:aspartokinase
MSREHQERSSAEVDSSADELRGQLARELPPCPVEVPCQEIIAFKFGCTSPLGTERMRHAAELVREAARRYAVTVVVSAMKGTTNQLLGIVRSLQQNERQIAGNEAQSVNSSDFSAAIIAHVVHAEELVIWTDVDSIFTANPTESAEARVLQEMSYEEAHALASAGAKVLHPRVLPLVSQSAMTVWVRNTFRPHVRGTRIGPAHSGGVA